MTNNFFANIDRNFSYEHSIILRYRKCVFPAVFGNKRISTDTDILQETSILEGVGIYPLIDYKGVKIRILDETSRMASGTFKSIDACLSIALCKSQGIKDLVFESGGNTGTAFSLYAAMLKMRTFLVVPLANVSLLSKGSFLKPYNYIVAVRNPQDTKVVSEKMSKMISAHRVPKLEWRYLAATFRGCRILEYLMEKQDIDWLSQTVSAGFGPIGIYKGLNAHREGLRKIPRFLGIQQEENCPYYKRIKEGRSGKEVHPARELLIPVMYDSRPFSYKAFDDFKKIMDDRGKLLTIGRKEFNAFSGKYLGVKGRITEILEEHGTFIYKENDNIVDKAGLVGLAGVFKAIDSGVIKKGEAVLHSLSSGTFRRKCTPTPDCIIDGTKFLDAQLNLFVESLGKNRVYAAR